MGTFGGLNGSIKIADDKKEIFTKQMIKLLNVGGMMEVENIKMYGKEMQLLKPLELDEEGNVHFYFNYFEDDSWESAGYKSKDCHLWSNKIGGREFADVILAGYMLYEAYSDGPCYVDCNGDIINTVGYMGWINNVLGTSFSMKNRFKIWEQIESYVYNNEEYEEPDIERMLEDIIPREFKYAAGGIDVADIMNICDGTSELESISEELVDNSYPADVYRCRQMIKEYYNSSVSSKLDNLIELLKKDISLRKKEKCAELKDIAIASLYMPARVFIYLAAELGEKKDFWEIWKTCKDAVYKDEVQKEYVAQELKEYRKNKIESPIEAVPTSKFLRQDGNFTFYDTPDEIKDRKNYYISDADRLYWYDGTNEVRISEDTEKWIRELADRHKEIKEKENLDDITQNVFKYLFTLFVELNDYYKRIFPFFDMFYEFLENGKKKEYAAAIKLLKELSDSEEYRKEGKIIEHAKYSWDLTSKNVTCNRARMKLKRYLSIMANKQLREKYFGF